MSLQSIISIDQSPAGIKFHSNTPVFETPLNIETEYFSVKCAGENGEVRSYTADPEEGFCRAGCAIQGMDYINRDLLSYEAADEPVISCIILLTFNLAFTRNFLIPSIISNTHFDHEIIIVHNGVEADLSAFEKFTVINSETGWVSRGYNAGVAAAKGKYIAIFHDDCIMSAPGWDKEMIAQLYTGSFATSTELVHNPAFNFHFLKGTPLVMRTQDYIEMGGHDENYFAGIEDLDFSWRMLAAGHTISKTVIPYYHFNGMSTVILLCGQPKEMQTLSGYCLIPANAIETWKTACMSHHQMQSQMHAVNAGNLRYFNSKFNGKEHSVPVFNDTRNLYDDWINNFYK